MNATETRDFRLFLQNELSERCRKNPRYSLRAFAKNLSTSHATLSQILSGKRKLTARAMKDFSSALGLGPDILSKFDVPKAAPVPAVDYKQQEIDTFIATSDWYYDAILELTRLKFFKPDHAWIAATLGISINEVNSAIERLFRLDLLKVDGGGRWLDASGHNTNNHLGDYSNTALRKYQTQVLEKASVAVTNVPRELRDNTSLMLTIDTKDIPEAKQKIKKFRAEMSALFKRSGRDHNSIYQVAISLFPITQPVPANDFKKSE